MKKLIYMAVLAAALVAIVVPQAWAAEDDNKFNFHGEVRFRGDYLNNASDLADSGSQFDNGDQGLFWPYRVRLAMEANFTKNVSAWIEIQSAGVAGNGSGFQGGGFFGPQLPPGFFRTGGSDLFGSLDGSNVEFYQGNVTLDKLWSDNFSLTIGRQELALGNELLVGDNDFYSGFSHDGLVGEWDLKRTDVTLWYFRTNEGSYPVGGIQASIPGPGTPPFPNQIVTPVSGGLDFYGAYSEWIFKGDQEFDVYLMYQDYRDFTAGPCFFGGGCIDDVASFGLRYGRDMVAANGFYWNIEYVMQFGGVDNAGSSAMDEDVSGDLLETWFGYNFNRGSNDHKVYIRYTAMSGDDPNSADWEGFMFVAGDIHDRLGKGDWFIFDTWVVGPPMGVDAWSIGYNGFFNSRHEFGIAYWDYSLNDSTGWSSSDYGNAYDIWYGFNYSRNVTFEAALSQFSPDGIITDPADLNWPASDDATRFYMQARLRF